MAVSLSIDFKLKNIKVAGFWTNAKANTKTFANSNRKIGVSCDCGRSHRALPTVPPLLPLTNVGQVSCFDCSFQYFHIPMLVVSIAVSNISYVSNISSPQCSRNSIHPGLSSQSSHTKRSAGDVLLTR